MLILGHVGITIGASLVVSGVKKALQSIATKKAIMSEAIPHKVAADTSLFVFWIKHIDIRMLILGSLLPDIIDKPVGHLLFREYFSNGRIFSHTLIFFIIISIFGLFYSRHYHKNRFPFLSFGILIHLALDQMWSAPRTLFWPVLGLAFDKTDISDWVGGIWQSLYTDPSVYIPEIVGFAIIVLVLSQLIKNNALYSFISNSNIS